MNVFFQFKCNFFKLSRFIFLVCIFEEESNWARPNGNVIRLHFARTTFLFRILICYNTRADDQIIVRIRSTQWQNMHYYTYIRMDVFRMLKWSEAIFVRSRSFWLFAKLLFPSNLFTVSFYIHNVTNSLHFSSWCIFNIQQNMFI